MEIWQAVIVSIVEGATELLPISSTGHMIIVSKWLGLEEAAFSTSFSIIIQLGAILAVLLHFRRKLQIKEWKLWVKVGLAFIPVGVVGLLFSDEIKALFSVDIVAVMFILGGIAFLWIEHWYSRQETSPSCRVLEEISLKQAMLIGVAQILSLVPGTSRAGATIMGGLLCKLDRKTSAEFSFLLALPVMLAVSGYEFLGSYEQFTAEHLELLMIGFVISFIVCYASIFVLLALLERYTFRVFGWYRIMFGVLLLLLS